MTNLFSASDRTAGWANTAAVLRSSHIWAAGCQTIMQSAALVAHAGVEQSWSNWTSIARANTLQERVGIQSAMIRKLFEQSMTEPARLTKASFQLVEQTMKPITARMVLPVETAPLLYG